MKKTFCDICAESVEPFLDKIYIQAPEIEPDRVDALEGEEIQVKVSVRLWSGERWETIDLCGGCFANVLRTAAAENDSSLELYDEEETR